MPREVDVVVIGMGPGGEDVAGALAQAGKSVVGIEAELVGGECPYWGCIPSKMMIRAANLLAETRRLPGVAGEAVLTPDFAPVARRIREEATDDWNDQVAVDRFVGKGGEFIRGRGELVSSDTVRVGSELFRARNGIVIATGTSSAIPPIDGLDVTPFWTNREAISTLEPPQSLIVLGGGATGCELAQVFARFGTKVTMIEAADRLMPLEIPAVGDLMATVFKGEGITVLTNTTASSVRHSTDGFLVTAGAYEVAAEQLLIVTGRRANLQGLGLDSAGLAKDTRFLAVDGQLRAGDGIWAVGDVTGEGAFTHVASYQARIATGSILGTPLPDADYRALPRVTFTDPEVGSVGLSPKAARAQGLRIRVGSTQVSHTARGWLHKVGNEGFIELVEDAEAGVLVGATSVGPAGGEVLGLLTLAVHARVPVSDLQSMIYAYPTFHRGVEDALRALEPA